MGASWAKSCREKVRHRSRKKAAASAAAARRETGQEIGYYHCGFCHHYHIGHEPGSRAALLPLIDENFMIDDLKAPDVFIEVIPSPLIGTSSWGPLTPPVQIWPPHTAYALERVMRKIERTKSKAHRRQLRAKFKRLLQLDNQIRFKLVEKHFGKLPDLEVIEDGQEKD